MKGLEDLDPAAKKIIAEGRCAIEPGHGVRERVLERVVSRLGTGSAILLTSRSMWASTAKWVAIGTCVGTAVGAAVYWQSVSAPLTPPAIEGSRQTAATDAHALTRGAPLVSSEANTSAGPHDPSGTASFRVDDAGNDRGGDPEVTDRAEGERAVSRLGPAAASVVNRSGDLAAEVSLLATANAALNRGDTAGARRALADYDRRFGVGQLREERAAAEVLLSCSSGDRPRAAAAAARFERRWPRSPLKTRIEKSCLGAK